MYDDAYLDLARETLHQNEVLFTGILKAALQRQLIEDIFDDEEGSGEEFLASMLSIMGGHGFPTDLGCMDDVRDELDPFGEALGQARIAGIDEATGLVSRIVQKLAEEDRLSEVPERLASRESIYRSQIELGV